MVNLMANDKMSFFMAESAGIIVNGKIFSYIENAVANKAISGSSENDYIENTGANVTVSAMGNDDFITSSSSNVTIYGGR